MHVLGIDIETASAADLKSVGAWRYSLHPSTRVWCVVLGWMTPVGDYKQVEWEPGQPVPECWTLANRDFAVQVLAHNCSFEKAILINVLGPQWGWFGPRWDGRTVDHLGWQDTQAHAAGANLPVTLEGLGKALGAPIQKDMAGHDLMKKMAWLDVKTHPGGRVEYTSSHDTPENRARLRAYCATDVRSMLEWWRRLPKLTEKEQRLWQLDQKINARGIHIDRPFVARMQTMVEERKRQLQSAVYGLSDGELFNSTAAPALKKWLKGRDLDLPVVKRKNGSLSESLDKNAVLELVASMTDDPKAKAVLETRIEANKATSLAKLDKIDALVDPRDGRIRNSLQFCGAHTGRWSSRGLQVHNFPRPDKGRDDIERAKIKTVRDAVYAGKLSKVVELCG